MISLDAKVLASDAAALDGAGGNLLSTNGFSCDDIEGMAAAQAIVSAIKQLESVLEDYQRLVEKNSERVKLIAESFSKIDRSMAS